MTVLSANKQRPVRLPVGGLALAEVKMAGYTNFDSGNKAQTIYHGSIVISDVSDTAGYVRAAPSSASVNAASGDSFQGVAVERQDVGASDLTDGSKIITVARNGVWGFPVGSVTIADIGKPAYASDDDTITTSSSNNWWVGTIEDVDATYVWVNIATAFGRLVSAAA